MRVYGFFITGKLLRGTKMAKEKFEIFNSFVKERYRLMWHISALSENRYRIAILSDKRGVLDEVTYRGGFYEQCLTMNQELSREDEKLYLEIENDADVLDTYKDDRMDSRGLGESFCVFCRSGSAQNYHEANILLWAVKENDKPDAAETADAGDSVFSFPLRNLAGQSCLSYFMSGLTADKINVKILNANKDITYVNIDSQCKERTAHLTMGSALTLKEGLQLEIKTEGNEKVQAFCDCTIAQGGSLSLVHYHVKSYDTAAGKLPFSMDILGWTAI